MADHTGMDPRLIVFLVVVGFLFFFIFGNSAMYFYARKVFPMKKKKPISKKKLKRQIDMRKNASN
ncbi:hypothetical protein ACHQM5_019278 [Ranunculus cassubicifolius]